MTQSELSKILKGLLSSWENETAEFKRAQHDYDTNKIGEYFSALSNEANLANKDRGWLVFGVDNKDRVIAGTNYRLDPDHLESLKNQIAQRTSGKITFRNIHEIKDENGRVLMFEIPPAPRGMPTSWNGHYFARAGESLVPIGLDKLDEIRSQTAAWDWSAKTIEDSTIDDLDERAVRLAREIFKQKHSNRISAEEVEAWSFETFLDRARVTQSGKITHTALLLLGKAECAWRLLPHPAQLTWKYEGNEREYRHFGPPFLVSTSELFRNLHNLQLRLLPTDSLLPMEVSKFDQRVILEALHNCIVHQDYLQNARITIIERHDRLVLKNVGSFFDGTPEEYLEGNKIPLRYRNPFLAQAMTELNMIDTMGFGIHDMFTRQAKRYLPMPDYDLSDEGTVELTIYSEVVDLAYSRLLVRKTDLKLNEILALDRVQKKLPIPKEAALRLRRAGLIEGRKPNYHISASIARATAQEAEYIRARTQDDEFYAKLLTDYLQEFDTANRGEINKLLLNKLSEALDERQKYSKISNLLTKLRRRRLIENTGSDSNPSWCLVKRSSTGNR